MDIRSLKKNLLQHPGMNVRFILPDGDPVPPEFHVTEVGHVVKNFIDCGGARRSQESCLLQTWVSEDDTKHRLTAAKLAKILDLSAAVVPSDELNVEVEYERCAVGQYTLDASRVVGDELTFTLGNKKTDCLAREFCGVDQPASSCGCGENPGKCC